MSFSRPRDWSILFSAAACLFFDLQLFFSPAMRPRKRAQSFFQPLCIILSSLFLGPETSCSEPRIFFRTPRHLFLDLRCFFWPLPERRTHKARWKANRKSGIRQMRKQKPSKKKIKGQSYTQQTTKIKNFLHTQQGESHTKSALGGLKAMKTNWKEPHARNNKNKHHNEKKATRNRFRGFKTMKRNQIQVNALQSNNFSTQWGESHTKAL